MMNIQNTRHYLIWLIIISLIVAMTTYFISQPKDMIFESKISYTVVPHTAVLRGNYQDLQASNLFIDVIKAWLNSPFIQNELSTNLVDATLTRFISTSMQTFEIIIMGDTRETAIAGATYVNDIIYREVKRHANLSGTGGYLLNSTELQSSTRLSQIWISVFLSFVTTLLLGGFILAIAKNKPKY